MLKGTNSALTMKILNDICKRDEKKDGRTIEVTDHEAIRELKPTWDLIIKHLIEHITTNATVTGTTVTQIGTQSLINGKIN